MPDKYGKWFTISFFFVAVLIPVCAAFFTLLTYFWQGGWFGDVSILPSWIAYLCLAFILLLGVSAFAFVIIMIVTMVRHWNDEDPKCNLSNNINSMSQDITSIKTKLGITEKQQEEEQKPTENIKKKAKKQKPKSRNR